LRLIFTTETRRHGVNPSRRRVACGTFFKGL
jgi:hypothetical protein